MQWLDEQLGRITMYRLVLYSLIIMALTALMLMFAGNLAFSPLAFLLSITVLVGTAYGANRLFGWLYGIRPHSESALITGLILSLLFTPPDDVIGFVKLALVATIAMASKYVIAIRGRHLFNPAAIGIVIASFAGLAFAGWWVATPGMAPATLFVAALILYRTKKLRVGLVFVGVALVSLLLRGTDIVTALTSWPLLFVAGVMLSEPLTLPPRAKQQFIVAGLVGLLMTVTFHYASITMTPALAIVIGNAVGWWYGQRRTIKLRFVGKKQLGATTYDLTFDTEPLQFEPGQYMELTLVHEKADARGHRRIFSIVGKPGEDQVSIGTKLPVKSSSFKRALMQLKPGAIVYATRVGGDFVLPDNPDQPVVCIAGGIGVTPYISYCMSTDRPMTLIYSVTNVSDLSYVEVLKQHNINVIVVTPDDDGKLPDHDWKRVNGVLNHDTLKKLIDVDKQPAVYISGPPGMVMSVQKTVKSLGIKHIKVDEFSGY